MLQSPRRSLFNIGLDGWPPQIPLHGPLERPLHGRVPMELEFSIHQVPKRLQRELPYLFPDLLLPRSLGNVIESKQTDPHILIVTTFQRATLDLVGMGERVEQEKTRLLASFNEWCNALNYMKKLQYSKFWLDFIDPCSGLPTLGTAGSMTYSEVDGAQLLLSYKIQQVGNCSVIVHPIWQTCCYPASLFTNLPFPALSSLLEALDQPICPSKQHHVSLLSSTNTTTANVNGRDGKLEI